MIDTPVLERVLAEALRHGGEFAEVFAEDRSTSSALLDDGRVEELSSGRERGAGIRVVSGDTTGFAHTADLTESGLLRAAEAASAVARSGGGGTGTVAVGPLRTGGSGAGDGRSAPITGAGLQGGLAGPAAAGRRGRPGLGRRHHPGAGGMRGLEAPGPDRQLRRALRP